MYTLVGSPRARPMRVLWMLEELGQDYEIQVAKPHSAPITDHNPGGKVPLLLVDGEPIADSVAIIQYLADKHSGCTHPAGTLARGQQDSFTHFALDEVDSPLWVWSKNMALKPEDQRVPEIAPVCAAEFATAMRTLDARLDDNPFVMGETFTVPDLLLGHCAGWAMRMPKWGFETDRVADYMARMRARPALKRAEERADAAIAAAAA